MKTISVRGVKEGITQFHTVGDVVTFTGVDEGDDDYHTFDQLYEHRHVLFLAYCKLLFYALGDAGQETTAWCSKLHADSTMFDGWFIAGINKDPGRQITYHLPLKYWDEAVNWCIALDRAPEYDGHESNDVLERLKRL